MDRLTAMQVFLTVAETGSFTATAARLSLSRPMVSRYIAVMEAWLNARLLHRTTRVVTLTAAGEQAVKFCQKIVNVAEQLEDEILVEENELRGTLRLAASVSLGASWLSEAVMAFQRHYPQLHIQLLLGDGRVNLVEDRIDLALRLTNQPDPALFARPLAECHSVLVASPDYFIQYGVPLQPADLAQHRLLAHHHLNRSEWLFQQGETEIHLKLTNVLSSNDAISLQQAALAGGGIAMLPRYLVENALATGKLVAVLTDWALPTLTLYALYSSRQRQPKAVRLLLDFLVEQVQHKAW